MTLHQLAMAEQAMMDALVEAGQTTQQGSSLLLDSPVPTLVLVLVLVLPPHRSPQATISIMVMMIMVTTIG
jgi:hypothetical protein